MLLSILIGCMFACYLFYEIFAKHRNLPPGPTPWPIVGNLLQVYRSHPEKLLHEWGKKYGRVFTIWFPMPIVIINDYDLMRETFLKQGDIFTGRNKLWKYKNLLNKGNYGLVYSSGRLWRENRRFFIFALKGDFGMRRNALRTQIMIQAEQLIKTLQSSTGPVTLRDPFTFAVRNIINVLLFGYAWKEDDPELIKFQKLFDNQQPSSTPWLMLLLDMFPWMRHFVPSLNVAHKRTMRNYDAFNEYVANEIIKHKTTLNESEPPRDFIDAYLIEMRKREKQGESELFTEWQLISAVRDVWQAAVGTMVGTLRFAILYLLSNHSVQIKLHEEIDRVVGKNGEVTPDDQKRLPYLCATEVQRLANIIPINIPHSVTEEIHIAGYKIPKDTTVIAQTASVHQDSRFFPDPEKFIPERHIDQEGRFMKSDYIMPFSIGKRACMGESLARQELFLLLGTLVQRCEFQPVNGKAPPPITAAPQFLRSPTSFQCVVKSR